MSVLNLNHNTQDSETLLKMKKSKSSKANLRRNLEDYINNVTKYYGKPEEFNWSIYEKHKSKIKTIINTFDHKLYEWAIERLTERLGI